MFSAAPRQSLYGMRSTLYDTVALFAFCVFTLSHGALFVFIDNVFRANIMLSEERGPMTMALLQSR